MKQEKRVHEKIKNLLIELGKEAGCEAYTGDSEPLDIRVKQKHFTFNPDVVWIKNGSYYVFEIAFTEDWRAVVGEYTLSWLKKNCTKFFVFRLVKDDESREKEYELLNNVMGILGKRFKKTVWSFWIFTEEELENFSKLKKSLVDTLLEFKFIRNH